MLVTMPVLTQPTPLYDFIDEFQKTSGAGQTALWLQLAIVLGCAGLAWVINRLVRRKMRKEHVAEQWRFGSEGVARVLYPTLLWLGMEVATRLWHAGHSVTLLKLAASLAFAFALVRIAVYLLKSAFSQAKWVWQYERAIAGLIWLLFALHLTGLLPEITDALDAIVFPLGKQHVSVLTVINALFSVGLTLLVALWLGRLAEQRVMAVDTLDISLRVVFTKVLRTMLVVVGVMVALPLVGIDLTVLSVFGGAVGVGLGFGLQKIASNYVSGFIILLDGSIRIGDLIALDTRQGTVTKITSRYVLLKLSDGSEAIIPNETLITSTVLNLSHTDKLSYVSLPVRVAYGSNLDDARQVLVEAVADHERILKEPAPQAYVKALGESGIDLELGFWICDLQAGVTGLKSELYLSIWRAFAERQIEIPSPRRDLYLMNDDVKIAANQSSSMR